MKQRNSGFTLVELMVTLVIGAILLMVAVPNFRTLLANNRLVAQGNDLVAGFAGARSEAIRQGTECRLYALSGSNWASGWTLRVDANSDGDFDDPGDILRSNSVDNGTTASTGIGHNLTNADYVPFNSRGEITQRTDRFEIELSHSATMQKSCVVVERTGRVFSESDIGSSDVTECER